MNFTKVFEFESLIGDVYGVFKYEDFIEVSDSTFSQKIKEKNSRYGEENHTHTVYKIDDFYIKVWDVFQPRRRGGADRVPQQRGRRPRSGQARPLLRAQPSSIQGFIPIESRKS